MGMSFGAYELNQECASTGTCNWPDYLLSCTSSDCVLQQLCKVTSVSVHLFRKSWAYKTYGQTDGQSDGLQGKGWEGGGVVNISKLRCIILFISSLQPIYIYIYRQYFMGVCSKYKQVSMYCFIYIFLAAYNMTYTDIFYGNYESAETMFNLRI